MKVPILLAVLSVCCLCLGQEQPWEENALLFTEAREDLDYIELMNTIGLTKEQLIVLQSMQQNCRDILTLTPEAAGALEEVAGEMLAGKSREEAIAELGPMQKELREMQQTMHKTLPAMGKKLRDSMSSKQRTALFLYNSPGRALMNVTQQIVRARKAQKEHWQGFRKGVTAGLLSASRKSGEKGTTAEAVQALLDSARGMADEEFQAKKASLVQEWGKVLMPELFKRAADPASRDPALVWACTRLITYSRGEMLVDLKLEALTRK